MSRKSTLEAAALLDALTTSQCDCGKEYQWLCYDVKMCGTCLRQARNKEDKNGRHI